MDFDILPATILCTKGGSRAYGTNLPTSDVDIKGIAIPPLKYIIGVKNFEQADSPEHAAKFTHFLSDEEKEIVAETKIEGQIYDWRKFFRLALDSNPNIWDVLFCRDQEILKITSAGEIIRENANLFLSRRARHSFGSYADAQIKRIVAHRKWLTDPPTEYPTREKYGLSERSLIPKNQMDAAFAMISKHSDSLEVDFSEIDGSLKIGILNRMRTVMTELLAGVMTESSEEDALWRSKARGIGIEDNLLEILDKERHYNNAVKNYKAFKSWEKSRNPDRAALEAKYGYDTKHGGHVVRLYRMAVEILQTGKVNVWRKDIDADEILSIRNGAWNFDQLISFAKEQDDILNSLVLEDKCAVPKNPDYSAVENLSIAVYEEHMRSI